MAFSAILGLGSSFLGMLGANKKANMEYSMYMQQLQEQRSQNTLMYGMAQDAKSEQEKRNEELRQIERMSQLQAQQERGYQMTEANKYADQLLAERQDDISRRVQADQEAARIQQFRLQEMLSNQQLSQQERQFAIQQLEQAKQVASSERADDIRRYYEDQERANIQREFMLGVYQDSTSTARSDQQRNLAVRDRITGQVTNLQQVLQAAYDSMGAAPEMARLTETDIQSEIDRRTQQYMSDVDRAGDRVASIGEAGLIRSGMDRSSSGTQARGEIAGRLADEYQTARNRAYDEALAFITGKVGALNQNTGQIMGQRGATLQELGGVAGAGMDTLMQLPNGDFNYAAFSPASGIGDGNISRQIGSSNNYQAPVGINSGIYDSSFYTMMPGMSEAPVGSAAANRSAGVGSAIVNPVNLMLGDPSTYFGMAANGVTSMLNNASNRSNAANESAGMAASLFGKNLTGFVNDFESRKNPSTTSFWSWLSGNTGPTPATGGK